MKSALASRSAPPQSTITAIYASNSGLPKTGAGSTAAQQLFAFLLERLDGLPPDWSLEKWTYGSQVGPVPPTWQNTDLSIVLGDQGSWLTITALSQGGVQQVTELARAMIAAGPARRPGGLIELTRQGTPIGINSFIILHGRILKQESDGRYVAHQGYPIAFGQFRAFAEGLIAQSGASNAQGGEGIVWDAGGGNSLLSYSQVSLVKQALRARYGKMSNWNIGRTTEGELTVQHPDFAAGSYCTVLETHAWRTPPWVETFESLTAPEQDTGNSRQFTGPALLALLDEVEKVADQAPPDEPLTHVIRFEEEPEHLWRARWHNRRSISLEGGPPIEVAILEVDADWEQIDADWKLCPRFFLVRLAAPSEAGPVCYLLGAWEQSRQSDPPQLFLMLPQGDYNFYALGLPSAQASLDYLASNPQEYPSLVPGAPPDAWLPEPEESL